MLDIAERILRPDGTLEKGAAPPSIAPEVLLRLYRTMLLNRRVDERMVTLQRQGRIGFYIGSTGEEAAVLGSVFPLKEADWLLLCYRELGAALWRGYPLYDLFCQLFGNADDAVKGRQMPNHYALPQYRIGSISSPIGTQIPQATGIAMAAKITGSEDIALTYFGDGATSNSDFHAGMNFAGVFSAPMIFLCRNNRWAISVPFSKQTASEDIAVKAQAYGIEGIRIDGNDIFAVISATQKAADKARAGGGPTLIEAETYRVSPHSTSDDPRSYRDEAEVEPWKDKDPILRLRRYLILESLWSEDKDLELEEEIQTEILTNLKKAESVGPPPLKSMFEDVYSDIPWHLKEQQRELQVVAETPVLEHKS
jgi:2-oxoisovalerate dehydrogenase E1 component alpha subunit